ncbi:MAG TPA: pyridoxamine 5'-phosphate oxidase family protein [Acidimicrobiales bacterium]|nr:pyridoxamine 5'-phosphate oxidase family protein [Acidimicrobiales bacterium]
MTTSSEQLHTEGFTVLDEEQCLAYLHYGVVGRVAVTIGAIPAVLPVNYLEDLGAIYFFTAAGTKLDAALHEAVVAFEVDGYDQLTEWGWSVLAVGIASEVHDREVREHVTGLGLHPWAKGPRDHLIRIWPEFLSGRETA